jgi:hypothetical protein
MVLKLALASCLMVQHHTHLLHVLNLIMTTPFSWNPPYMIETCPYMKILLTRLKRNLYQSLSSMWPYSNPCSTIYFYFYFYFYFFETNEVNFIDKERKYTPLKRGHNLLNKFCPQSYPILLSPYSLSTQKCRIVIIFEKSQFSKINFNFHYFD